MPINGPGVEARPNFYLVREDLMIHMEESGWFWCANQRGQSGWIPAEHFRLRFE